VEQEPKATVHNIPVKKRKCSEVYFIYPEKSVPIFSNIRLWENSWKIH